RRRWRPSAFRAQTGVCESNGLAPPPVRGEGSVAGQGSVASHHPAAGRSALAGRCARRSRWCSRPPVATPGGYPRRGRASTRPQGEASRAPLGRREKWVLPLGGSSILSNRAAPRCRRSRATPLCDRDERNARREARLGGVARRGRPGSRLPWASSTRSMISLSSLTRWAATTRPSPSGSSRVRCAHETNGMMMMMMMMMIRTLVSAA
ncbi:hypothetical protein T492DRAFT_47947, partial [Pavlovales sp. CCMP2436]